MRHHRVQECFFADAAAVGVDVERLRRDIQSDRVASRIEQDLAEAGKAASTACRRSSARASGTTDTTTTRR